MTKFIYNEYYRWSPLHILHFVIALSVIILSVVVLNEPIVIAVTAASMSLTYFLAQSKSRLVYLSNVITTSLYSYSAFIMGLYATSLVLTLIMLPLSVFILFYVYLKRIYIEDYEHEFKSRGLLPNIHFFIIAILLIAYVLAGLYICNIYDIKQYNEYIVYNVTGIIDLIYSFMLPVSVILIYYSKYEFKIATIINNFLMLLVWGLLFLNYSIGFSMIVSIAISIASSRMTVLWWLVKK